MRLLYTMLQNKLPPWE
uniref:Uncharacterized protein n=1 Tax=Anguilla anguilla TaxID=7936 RepID=A0A0E9QXG4_ANGAN